MTLRTPFLGFLCLALLSLNWGCAGAQGPEVLSIPSGKYELAFDTAVEVARSRGMQPVLLDRRTGVIETDPVIAGTILEPWYQDTADFAQGIDNTLSQYRMKARFEFMPAGMLQDSKAESGPDLLGIASSPIDLTTTDRAIELRVQVFRERRHTVGQRRHTWSRRMNSRTLHGVDDETWESSNTVFWTPESRDDAAERRMLAEVASDMKLPSSDLQTAAQAVTTPD